MIIRMLGGAMFLIGAFMMAFNLFMTVQSASTNRKPAGLGAGFVPVPAE
jgi:cbb3-type cytochrome oxidase subunit 1